MAVPWSGLKCELSMTCVKISLASDTLYLRHAMVVRGFGVLNKSRKRNPDAERETRQLRQLMVPFLLCDYFNSSVILFDCDEIRQNEAVLAALTDIGEMGLPLSRPGPSEQRSLRAGRRQFRRSLETRGRSALSAPRCAFRRLLDIASNPLRSPRSWCIV